MDVGLWDEEIDEGMGMGNESIEDANSRPEVDVP